ncbi:MAG: peptide chain release factor N(5)-glutamine methyltransferase [Hyphomicrobiaceae bacterium]|nr:peptide chain release factor N(5)-glutamine methyltransferase [Hyphomicrobiaceae bacterium]
MSTDGGESIEACRRRLTAALQAAGKTPAGLEARRILGHVLGLGDADLVLKGDEPLDAAARAALDAMLAERLAGKPLARLVGRQGFFDFELDLAPQTLVPRADTEILVEAVAGFFGQKDRALRRFVDLGTGSGAIAIALLRQFPQALGVATDCSPEALAAALANAGRLGVAARLEVRCGDWFDALSNLTGADLSGPDFAGPFDLIVSNPPYIRDDVIETLEPEVRVHDPVLALSGGADGLDAYRAILSAAGRHLAPKGLVALEIGHDQADAVSALGDSLGFQRHRLVHDLAGKDRVLLFTLKENN